MSPRLTYRPREGVVFGVVAGKAIRLTTLRNQAGMAIQAWRQVGRPGRTVPPRLTPWEKVQEVPHAACRRRRPHTH